MQEGVNNIVKHSGARSARVEVKRYTRGVQISVADDGKGFSPDGIVGKPLAVGSGFGLVGIL